MLELFKKELTLELRRKSVIAGLVLYLASTVFICYLTFSLKQNNITPLVWSALFWITILFTSVNTVAKSFIGEKNGVAIYLYSIASPQSIILTKILYNFLLCLVMELSGFGLFVLFLQQPVENLWLFLVIIVLASMGFAASLTILSAVAAKAGNSNVIMALLSFPVIIALLLLVISTTKNAIDGLDWTVSQGNLIILLAINCLLTAISFLLFPYIWRT